jgi:metal-responsive CopG/Arc/MetJ family transcriptional regulator
VPRRYVMARVNVFLKDELLDEINEEAKDEGTNRSALIQTALEKYIEAKRHEREKEEKQKRMQEASKKMDALAKKLGKWDPQATIRKFRDTNLKGNS